MHWRMVAESLLDKAGHCVRGEDIEPSALKMSWAGPQGARPERMKGAHSAYARSPFMRAMV